MNSVSQKVRELIAALEASGLTPEQISQLAQDAERRERGEALDFDPLDEISSKIDRLQESIDALAARLDQD